MSPHGRSLPEYAIILTLIALAAIPALMLLSGSIGNLFANNGVSRADQLFALLDSKSSGGTTGAAPSGAIVANQAPLAAALSDLRTSGGTIAMNLDGSGNLQIKLNGIPLGSAQDSTGANGNTSLVTYVMADQIQALADQMAQEGQDPALVAKLRYISALGRTVAQSENYIVQAIANKDTDPNALTALTVGAKAPSGYGTFNFPTPPDGSLPPPLPSSSWGAATPQDLAGIYSSLQASMSAASQIVLESMPPNTNFRGLFNTYTGAIDVVAQNNFTSAGDIFTDTQGNGVTLAKSSSSLTSSGNRGEDLLRKIDTSGVTIDIAPKFTQVTADKIAQAQQAASATLDIPPATTAAAPTAPSDGVTSNFSGSALPN